MGSKEKNFSSKQIAFKEIAIGTLIYCVILGFFNDYTDLVEAKSFSIIFLSSFVLEVLTFIVFMIKNRILKYHKDKQNKSKTSLVLSLWFVAFLSKFVFIGSINFFFNEDMNINGFFAILLIAVLVTAIHKVLDLIFMKLDNTQ